MIGSQKSEIRNLGDMVKGFSTKKLKGEKSLGQIFKNARKRKNISLSEAEVGTMIKGKFLEALENSEWNILPSPVYIRGFALAYGKFLHLSESLILDHLSREMMMRQISDESQKISYNHKLNDKKVLITPKFLAYFALSSFVLCMIIYVMVQVLSFAGNPSLAIISPSNNIVTEEESLAMVGLADTDSNVTVNSETVPVSGDGKFQIDLRLHRGVNVIKIQATIVAAISSAIFGLSFRNALAPSLPWPSFSPL